MRKIKYRGFNRKNGKWLYGFYLQNRGAHFVCPDEFATDKSWDDYEVEPETVGQFTGLTDIDSREIYEGDVLHFDEHNYRMVWLDNTGEFAALKIELSMLSLPVNYCVVSFWSKIDLKIIGNIYDNPELIAEDMYIQIKED